MCSANNANVSALGFPVRGQSLVLCEAAEIAAAQ